MKTVAVIVAGGKGTRIEGKLPKQFTEIAGKPVVVYTLEKFELCDSVDEICLVVPEDFLSFSQEMVNKFHFKKLNKIIPGGEKRQDSVYKGLLAIPDNTSFVVVHDGVRPLVKVSKIKESIRLCKECKAVILAVPVKETVKRVENLSVITTLNREKLWSIQTPQTFDYILLVGAYKKAEEDGFSGTDSSSLVERLGVEVKVLEGDYDNIKITTKKDLIFAEEILKSSKK